MPIPTDYVTTRGANIRGTPVNFSAIYKLQLTDPAAADADAFVTTVAGPNTTTVTYYRTGGSGNVVFAGIIPSGKVDYPRNVVITVTHASSVVALSGVITGIDWHGRVTTEAWSVTATGTSKTFTGAKAFKRVDSVTVVAAADASANSVVIGTGKVFGFPVKVSVASAVKEVAAGSVVTNGTVVAASTASTADAMGTYTPNGSPNAADDYSCWVISDSPEST
jgi:hypothetical protein